MSELEKRKDLSRFNSMSTEELQEILRKHTHGELETEPDTQDLFEIMEVLSKRRQQQNPHAFRSDEEALAEFRKHYMPKESRTVTQHKATKSPSRLLRTIAAVLAVVLILAAGTTITAKALNFDIWRKFASWTTEIFHFTDGPQTSASSPAQSNNVELASLLEALAQHKIPDTIVPTWLPDGYKHKDITIMQSPKATAVYAVYKNNNLELIISVRQSIGIPAHQVEKNEGLLEIYAVNGVEYFIFSNTQTLQATWVLGEFECEIIGNVTIEEMRAMIDSI